MKLMDNFNKMNKVEEDELMLWSESKTLICKVRTPVTYYKACWTRANKMDDLRDKIRKMISGDEAK